MKMCKSWSVLADGGTEAAGYRPLHRTGQLQASIITRRREAEFALSNMCTCQRPGARAYFSSAPDPIAVRPSSPHDQTEGLGRLEVHDHGPAMHCAAVHTP